MQSWLTGAAGRSGVSGVNGAAGRDGSSGATGVTGMMRVFALSMFFAKVHCIIFLSTRLSN